MTPFTGDRNIAETSEDRHNLAPGERLPHQLLHELRQFVVLRQVVGVDVHLGLEKLVRFIDRFAATVFESEYPRQCCEGLDAGVFTWLSTAQSAVVAVWVWSPSRIFSLPIRRSEMPNFKNASSSPLSSAKNGPSGLPARSAS